MQYVSAVLERGAQYKELETRRVVMLVQVRKYQRK